MEKRGGKLEPTSEFRTPVGRPLELDGDGIGRAQLARE